MHLQEMTEENKAENNWKCETVLHNKTEAHYGLCKPARFQLQHSEPNRTTTVKTAFKNLVLLSASVATANLECNFGGSGEGTE